MSNKIGGPLHFNIGGSAFSCNGEGEITFARLKREALVDDQGRTFFTEMPQAGSITATLLVVPGLDVHAVTDGVDGTAVISGYTGDGRRYVLRNAVHTGDGKVTPNTGQLPVIYHGDMEVSA